MSKHTPGPWLSRGKSDSVHQLCDTHPYGQLIFQFHDEFGPNDDDLALILAAPELLAALERLTEWGQRTIGPWQVEYTGDHPLATARTAIAKARGL